MRLGQLARKLSLRPAQIVEFLAKNNIQIEENSNYRLEDSHAEMIAQHFAPGSLQEIIAAAAEISAEEIQPGIEPVAEPETFENKTPEEIEVIRVQKIELSGLKVLGKIDLPELKKKSNVEPEAGNEVNTETKPAEMPLNPNRKTGQYRERQKPRPWKNPLELQREREAREER